MVGQKTLQIEYLEFIWESSVEMIKGMHCTCLVSCVGSEPVCLDLHHCCLCSSSVARNTFASKVGNGMFVIGWLIPLILMLLHPNRCQCCWIQESLIKTPHLIVPRWFWSGVAG